MNKYINIVLLVLITMFQPSFASCEDLVARQTVQKSINNCGYKILNANKIQKRIIFVYDSAEKKALLKNDNTLLNREIIVYSKDYKFFENNDEMAAFLAREISLAERSFDGVGRGFLRTLQVKAAPKKFEIVADKRAVDYMVNAGYNPIALITHIQKTSAQKRQDLISTHNLTSKRLAIIYEYIYYKYPYFIKDNPYLYSESYQNFLLTSKYNRNLLYEKIKNNSKEKLKYE